MIVRFAEENELEKWKIIAKDVAKIFGNPTMDEDLEFIDYAQRKIKQKEAIIATDDENKEFYGFIGFSKHYNRITWFSVLEKYRNKGIGYNLLEKAIKELDKTKEITVETYRENYIPGKPARHIFEKFGFKETENDLFDNFGNERCKLIKFPNKQEKE
jgi:ribosomal protein S18 acetylase RimI-like enzyme